MAIVPIQGRWEDLVAAHGSELQGHNVVVIVLDSAQESVADRSKRLAAWDKAMQMMKDAPVLDLPLRRADMYEDPN